MGPMTVTVPDELVHRGELSADDVRLDLALGLYVSHHATLGMAAELAGVSQSDFLDQLGKCRIPVHYDPVDLESDIRNLSRIREKLDAPKP
jgi:predicted HTH domain antitoxin